MKEVNKDILKDCANRLMFSMSEEEYDVLLNEFNIILKQLELMDNIEGINETEPMSFPYGELFIDFLRDDEVLEDESLKKEELLNNAKDVKDGQVKLPKVVN